MLSLILAVHCLFNPPPKWEIADPKTPSKRVIASFVDKSKSGFCPSINLTHEKVSIPTEEYLTIVAQNAKAKKQTWKHLGTIETQSGLAELIEIETKNNLGQIRLLQALLRQGEDLFILTAAALKKDFGKHAVPIKRSIQTMNLCDDLIELIKDEDLKKTLKTTTEKAKFQQEVINYKDLGPVWQLLMLEKKREEL